MSTNPPTAGAIIIGNEVLSGKVVDQNTGVLITELRKLGVQLKRVSIIDDDIDVIAAEVKRCSAQFDWVFTTGGLGPTHDDVTIEAIAKAFDVPLVQSEELNNRLLQLKDKDRIATLERMTFIPDGAKIYWGEEENDRIWPTVFIHNVYIFPGVPTLFRSRFAAMYELLRSTPVVCHTVYCSLREVDVVTPLNATVDTFPEVDIGSYPQFGDVDHRVRITFESVDAEATERALDDFVKRLPAEAIVRIRRDT
jgi:molybdenum cofactor synthesis domain-containing protein